MPPAHSSRRVVSKGQPVSLPNPPAKQADAGGAQHCPIPTTRSVYCHHASVSGTGLLFPGTILVSVQRPIGDTAEVAAVLHPIQAGFLSIAPVRDMAGRLPVSSRTMFLEEGVNEGGEFQAGPVVRVKLSSDRSFPRQLPVDPVSLQGNRNRDNGRVLSRFAESFRTRQRTNAVRQG